MLKILIIFFEEDIKGLNQNMIFHEEAFFAPINKIEKELIVKRRQYRSQSYEWNLVFKKSKFVLNSLTAHFFNLDHNNKAVKSELK